MVWPSWTLAVSSAPAFPNASRGSMAALEAGIAWQRSRKVFRSSVSRHEMTKNLKLFPCWGEPWRGLAYASRYLPKTLATTQHACGRVKKFYGRRTHKEQALGLCFNSLVQFPSSEPSRAVGTGERLPTRGQCLRSRRRSIKSNDTGKS